MPVAIAGIGAWYNINMFVLPIVWKIFDEVLKESGKELAKSFFDYLRERWRSRNDSSTDLPDETDEQSVSKELKIRLLDNGIDEERIDVVIATIVATLQDKALLQK